MKKNYLKEFYKNKLFNLIFEAMGPPTPYQPPTQSQDPQIPRIDPNDTQHGAPLEWEIDPDDIRPERPSTPANPHNPVYRPNGIPSDKWHPIPGTNPPKYYHDLGNGYGQGYRWNPTTQQFEPYGSPTIIPQNMPGGLPVPTGIPVPNGGQVYTDPNGNLYLRDPNGTIYYWDNGTNRWVEITDPSYLPVKPMWNSPSPGPMGTPGFIPNPLYVRPPDYSHPIGPLPRRPGFGGIVDRFNPFYRPYMRPPVP